MSGNHYVNITPRMAEALVAVKQAESAAGAARAMGVDRQTIVTMVTQAERILRVRLFSRSRGRGLSRWLWRPEAWARATVSQPHGETLVRALLEAGR